MCSPPNTPSLRPSSLQCCTLYNRILPKCILLRCCTTAVCCSFSFRMQHRRKKGARRVYRTTDVMSLRKVRSPTSCSILFGPCLPLLRAHSSTPSLAPAPYGIRKTLKPELLWCHRHSPVITLHHNGGGRKKNITSLRDAVAAQQGCRSLRTNSSTASARPAA